MKTAATRPGRRLPGRRTYACPLRLAEDVPGCGGKARSLARLLRLGLPVPPGFVVTDCAFQEFLDHNRLRAAAAGLWEGLDVRRPESVRSAARAMRDRILGAAVPAVVWEALQERLAPVLSGAALIVRSSAVGEDAAQASFAGQLESFPDVTSEAALREALLRCWASYWSERSLFYQLARGVRLGGMGVLIQEQVAAWFSGVLFTRSPTPAGGVDDALVAEYCLGPGEALVAGRVNPGRLVISRGTLACRRLALPEQAGVAGADAAPGTAQVASLARAGLALEEALGGPQDIEWVVGQDGRLYLVQSRPITVPAAPPHAAGPPVAWSNANVNENFPGPVSPLLYSIAAEGYYHYFRNLGVAFGIAPPRVRAMEQPLRHLIGVHGARLYYNLTNLHAVLREAPFGDVLAEFFDGFVGTGPTPRPQPPPVRGGKGSGGRLRQALEVGRIAWRMARHFLSLSRRVGAFERMADAFAARTAPAALESRPLSELRDDLRAFLDIRCHRWLNASLADAAAMISYGALQRILRREFAAEGLSALHNTLLKGLRNVVSGGLVDGLWDLSRQVRADPGLAALFTTTGADEILAAVRMWPGFAGFRANFEAFLERWGFRRSGELMLTVPSFQEEPAQLVETLRAYAALEGESPADVLGRQEAERTAATARVLRELRGRRLLPLLPWPTRASLVKLLLAWTQKSIALRERARLKQALLYARCRRIALAIGDRLVRRGSLQVRDDVFFLTHQELDALLAGGAMYPDQVRELVGLRQAGHARLSAMNPPDTFELAEGSYLPASAAQPDPAVEGPGGGGDRMRGVGACGGQATGPAAVLTDVAQIGRLRAGDVLVTRQTDPGWAPVFFLVRGLVLERGGMLSHGAILAREYGIPTVVGVREATRRIAPGQTVSVNGDRGLVQLAD